VAVRAAVGGEDEHREMARALGFGPFHGQGHGLSTLLDGDLAGFLSLAPEGEVDGVVGIGPPRSLDKLWESFRLASRALTTAQGFGLRGAYDVPGLGLRAAIIADGDVGQALTARYVDPLISEASGHELIASLRAYFECGMHFERAAARLFVHQNTLRYRIGRFEAITGANLREPTVAFEVWWALERYAVSADRHGDADDFDPAPSSER
jgi:DNA-binding PucR family transcriptional regulator